MYTVCIESLGKKVLGRNRRSLKAAESYALELRARLNRTDVPLLWRISAVLILDHFAKEIRRI